MASIRFIVTDDRPEALAFQGDALDMLALTSYMIGKMYAATKKTDPVMAETYRAFLSKSIADPEGPVWDVRPQEGETVIAFAIPQEEDG